MNRDGKNDGKDVEIVYEILDKKIIKNKGGLGRHEKQSGFLNRQMVHFDVSGKHARWSR